MPPVEVAAYADFVADWVALPPDFSGESRPVEEYSGYTYIHLPKSADAMPASFAARMAFSSF